MKKWLLVAVAAGVLLMLPAILMRDSGDVESEAPQPTPEEVNFIERLIAALQRGEIHDARVFYNDQLSSSDRISGDNYERLLNALHVGQQRARFTKEGIDLYGEILADVARKDVELPSLRFHVRRLRHQALSLDDKERLYQPAAFRLMEYQGLARADARLLPDIIDYHLLFGGDQHWRDALALLPDALARERRDPERRWDLRLHPLRALARIAGESHRSEAIELFKDTLGSLGDGSDQDIAAFNEWYPRVMELPDEPPWAGHANRADYYGRDSDSAMQVRNWLAGVYRYFNADSGLNRGAARIQRALDGLNFGPYFLFRLDLAESLRAEANRLEGLLHDQTLVVGNDRVKQLYEVAWGAVRTGDHETVEDIISRLVEQSDIEEVVWIRRLFGAALRMSEGSVDIGVATIRSLIDHDYQILEPAQLDEWRAIVASRKLPVAKAEDVGRILLDTGILWDDMREIDRLAVTVARLRGEQTKRRDRYYLDYLTALLRYRRGDVDALAGEMRKLLDQTEPPGVKRSAVAGLAFAVDRRAEDIAQIASRRRKILDVLLPAIKRDVADNSMATLLADIIGWQVQMDITRGEYLDTDEGRERFQELLGALDTEGELDFPLEEKWIELKREMLRAILRFRNADKLDKATRVLELAKRLIKNQQQYRHEEALILERRAQQISIADASARRQAWALVGAAYADAASTEFGDPELFYEAGEAYVNAEDYGAAREVLANYDANRQTPVIGEARYWGKKALLARSFRKLGLPKKSLEMVEMDELADAQGARAHFSRFQHERGLALEALDRTDEAIQVYDETMSEVLDPEGEAYIDALHRKAVLTQRRFDRIYDDANQTRANKLAVLEETHLLWAELAAKIRPASGDVRLADALYHSGVLHIERNEFEPAQRAFDRLERANELRRNVVLSPAHVARWEARAISSVYAYADSLFMDGKFDEALRRYEQAVERAPQSPQITWAFWQQAKCALQRNDKAAAMRLLRLGKKRLDALTDEVLAQLPPEKNREFWIGVYDSEISSLSKE